MLSKKKNININTIGLFPIKLLAQDEFILAKVEEKKMVEIRHGAY
jgi:hypothetical protein